MDIVCAGGGCRTTVRRSSDSYPFCSPCQENRVHAYLREMKKIETAKKTLCHHCREEIYLDGTKWLIGGGENWLHISDFQPYCRCIAKPSNEEKTNEEKTNEV